MQRVRKFSVRGEGVQECTTSFPEEILVTVVVAAEDRGSVWPICSCKLLSIELLSACKEGLPKGARSFPLQCMAAILK